MRVASGNVSIRKGPKIKDSIFGPESMGGSVFGTVRQSGSACLGQGAAAGVHRVPAEHLLDAEELVVLGGAVGAAE